MMASSRTPQQEAASQASQEEGPTAAFCVDLPATTTLSPEGEGDSSQSTSTSGPTITPRPTKTLWPTQAPTPAPVDDPGMVHVPGGEFIFGSDEGKEDESPQQRQARVRIQHHRFPLCEIAARYALLFLTMSLG
ncbi:MAG: hypothetical protein ACLFV5_01460 [Anaerolineales bacterium]